MSENSHSRTPDIPQSLTRPVEMRAFDMSAGETVRPHAHEWGQFTYSAEGVLTVLTPAGRFTAPPAMAVWLPPGVEHDIRPIGHAKFRSLYIAADHLAGMPEACVVLSVDPLLRELILEAARLPIAWDIEGPQRRLMTVLLDRIRAAVPAPLHLPLPKDARLRAVSDALLAEPSDSRTLADFAATAGASERTLSRHFKDETGMTFGEWRRQRILLAALERLSEGMPVTTVAMEMGYDSPSAFIAMFRQSLGVTPAQYFAAGD